MNKITINLGVVILATLFHPLAQGIPGESLTLDSTTGDYTIIYADNLGNLQRSKLVPRTKISPSVHSRFKVDSEGVVYLKYAISNGGEAKQPIGLFGMYGISSLYSSRPLPPYSSPDQTLESGLSAVLSWNALVTSPVRWHGDASPDLDRAPMVQAGWTYESSEQMNENKLQGVMPGERQTGFAFQSKDLPGIGIAKFWGDTPIGEGYVDDGPNPQSEVGKQLHELQLHNFVTRYAAIPAIAVPNPFDAARLLDRIRAEMNTWSSKQLLDTAYSAQLDRYLVSAAEAYRLNNPKAAKEHLHTLRKMLAKEHHHVDNDDADDEDTEEHKRATRRSIDRLAARVLDFDLRYVLKRMEQGHDKNGRGKDDHRKEDTRKR